MKVILKNLFSLGFVQGINLMIPLIVTPYLIKTIGVSNFGTVALAQSVVAFLVLFVDFGFNVTSVRRIAQAHGNKQEIKDIINGVFFLKAVLLIASFIIFLAVIVLVPQFKHNFFIFLFSFTIVIGQAFLPIWFYQGTEEINKTIIPVVIFKIFSTALIFYFIKTKADTPYINFYFGLGNILTGLVLYYFITRNYGISIKHVTIRSLKDEVKGSIAIFFSNLSVVLYSNSALFILSFFLTPHTLGIYSIVDKMIQILKALLGLVHQVTYPRICNMVKEAENSLSGFIKKMYSIVWSVILVVCVLLFLKPGIFVSYFVKDQESQIFASEILRYFSFILFIVSLNMPFYQTLLAYKKDWLTVRILFLGSLTSVILNIILVPLLNVKGTIISMYVAETLVTTLLAYYTLKLKIIYDHRKLFK
ncbi:MAG: oligosaccharide flippase family protein [Ferruginibacter sp.]